MKELILLITLGLCSLAYGQKFATIDMDSTFLNYYKTIAAEKTLKKQVSLLEDRAGQLERKHKEAVAQYQKLLQESSSILLSEEARSKKKEDADAKENEIKGLERNMRSYSKNARDMLAKQHNESRAEILKEIQKVIEMIAKNKGIDLVLDTSGKTSNLIPSVVYDKGNNSITEEVLTILNKGHEQKVEEHKKEMQAKQSEKKSD